MLLLLVLQAIRLMSVNWSIFYKERLYISAPQHEGHAALPEEGYSIKSFCLKMPRWLHQPCIEQGYDEIVVAGLYY